MKIRSLLSHLHIFLAVMLIFSVGLFQPDLAAQAREIPADSLPVSSYEYIRQVPEELSNLAALNASVSSASSNTYYVATTGNDANPGTQVSPWATIQKAANTMVAGETVIVSAGDYSNQRVSITHSGASTTPISYQAQGQVVMKGFNIVANYITINGFEIANTDYRRWGYQTSAGIYVKGAYNTLENNYIHDASLVGIELYGPPGDNLVTHDNIIRNNRLYHNELSGIEVSGRNNLIEGNEVWRTIQCHPNLTKVEDIASDNNGTKCPYYTAVSGLDADGMRFFGQGDTFRKNNIHDIVLGDTINGVNVNVTPHIDCFQTFAGTTYEMAQNIIFEQNYCENLNIGMAVFTLSGGANHLYIRNNIFKATGGIHNDSGADYLYIYNNVWANNLAFGTQGHPGAIKLAGIHAIIQNNIFYDQAEYTVQIIGDTTNIKVDYNLAYNSDGTTPHCVSWGNYNICQPAPNHELWKVDPQFVNPESGDFHLTSTSPAIDAGYNLGTSVPNDYDGISRPQGAGFDIGAFEFQSSLIPTATQTRTPTKTPTSTPTYTSTRTPTRTSTSTFTRTPTRTSTSTFTRTPTRTSTSTFTRTPTRTSTSTITRTPTRTSTSTLTRTPTRTTASTLTSTPSHAPTLTIAPTITSTQAYTSTPSYTPTLTTASTLTNTPAYTPTATQTIPGATFTPSPTATTGGPPADFVKLSPPTGSTGNQSKVVLSWEDITGASYYLFCYDTVNNNICDTSWTTSYQDSATINNLSLGRTYYWQVVMVKPPDSYFADNGAWWNFTTMP